MNFALGTHLSTLLASVGTQDAITPAGGIRSALQHSRLGDDYMNPCQAESDAYDKCVADSGPDEDDIYECIGCVFVAMLQLAGVETCDDVKEITYCEDINKCATEHCFDECVAEFKAIEICEAEAYGCDACTGEGFAIA
eukprot:CAMPEP_0171335484 /NCGR_PEP_ID=MMETSP0878-20121228/5362_1 /TAXON_ID=67004 /ORGANISM="Thalassiosira weissflogii, Strain CCMP1336" /LENGTH=138 /DNA_ID=CAMNT_0011836759 /DNA_START=117 /DNA_END=533 /DNA_ORIENTATION=+